jgi:uracil-DNA glycosylase family 4
MTLDDIAKEINVCTRCELHRYRQKTVPGEGPDDARIVFVGEAPGREEDNLGRPFVGRSGEILNEILVRTGLARADIFITSVVKCRPPHNRVPRKKECETCIDAHLWRQIEAANPTIICLLGGVAVHSLLAINGLSDARGKIFRRGAFRFFPTYHPAAAGRNRTWRRGLLEDMARLHALVQSELNI